MLSTPVATSGRVVTTSVPWQQVHPDAGATYRWEPTQCGPKLVVLEDMPCHSRFTVYMCSRGVTRVEWVLV